MTALTYSATRPVVSGPCFPSSSVLPRDLAQAPPGRICYIGKLINFKTSNLGALGEHAIKKLFPLQRRLLDSFPFPFVLLQHSHT